MDTVKIVKGEIVREEENKYQIEIRISSRNAYM